MWLLGQPNCDGKPCFWATGYRVANGVSWSYGAHRNRLSCGPLREVGTPSILHGSARTFSRFPEQPVEGTFERAPHLRALQSRDAAGGGSCDLQAQPPAKTAPGVRDSTHP